MASILDSRLIKKDFDSISDKDITKGFTNSLIVIPKFGLESGEESKIKRILKLNSFEEVDLLAGFIYWNCPSHNKRLIIDEVLFDSFTSYQLFREYIKTSQSIESKKLSLKTPQLLLSKMKSQLNSEHCRHHLFNKKICHINKYGKKNEEPSLFSKIKSTKKAIHSDFIISAYRDNASCIKGERFSSININKKGIYSNKKGNFNLTLKAETHNHPTAIAPYPGAGTGVGGEIRDEMAVGKGGISSMGFAGFVTSDLNFNTKTAYLPKSIKDPIFIMTVAPLGAADYSNEYGRPQLHGFFRTVSGRIKGKNRGFYKPLMLVGGTGIVKEEYSLKPNRVMAGSPIIVLGGPARRIGLGGAAVSSEYSGKYSEEIDFSSVQRCDPEMQRICYEVLNRCIGTRTNIISTIHDVGAGGLSCAIPELLADSKIGLTMDIGDIPNADKSLTPAEIWTCEAQERFVLAINKDKLSQFNQICEHELCEYKVLGYADLTKKLSLFYQGKPMISTELKALFEKDTSALIVDTLNGNTNKTTNKTTNKGKTKQAINWINEHRDDYADNQFNTKDTKKYIKQVLRLPSVGRKSFLIHIGDRSVGGLTARDQLVGPYQEPVSDVAVTATDHFGRGGQALACGEKIYTALFSPERSAKLALAEALNNIHAAPIGPMNEITLSANWMADKNYYNDISELYKEVNVLVNLCRSLNICISVGKDSLSMSTKLKKPEGAVSSPPHVVITALAKVSSLTTILTPELKLYNKSALIRISHKSNNARIGGSALIETLFKRKQLAKKPKLDMEKATQVAHAFTCPDIDSLSIKELYDFISLLHKKYSPMAYHDISDGGLIVCLLEMAFTSRIGLTLVNGDNADNNSRLIPYLFSEEPGVVVQLPSAYIPELKEKAKNRGLQFDEVAVFNQDMTLKIPEINYSQPLAELWQDWNYVNHTMVKIRSGLQFADSEQETNLASFKSRLKTGSRTKTRDMATSKPKNMSKYKYTLERGIYAKLHANHYRKHATKTPIKVALLRSMGSNGHYELAQSLIHAGFKVMDITLQDIIEGRSDLNQHGLMFIPGGFTFGDALGAGKGVASSILYNQRLKDEFYRYFKRKNTISIGICNGCQILSHLRGIVPGGEGFPHFGLNKSSSFEARLTMVRIPRNPSYFFKDFIDEELPVIISHKEGRAYKTNKNTISCLSYLSNTYPINPNGSQANIAGATSTDGRCTILMPHPERLFAKWQFSYLPPSLASHEKSPWLSLFENLKKYVC